MAKYCIIDFDNELRTSCQFVGDSDEDAINWARRQKAAQHPWELWRLVESVLPDREEQGAVTHGIHEGRLVPKNAENHQPARGRMASMDQQQRKIYQSENGDSWWLCEGKNTLFVLHEANASSGGTVTKVELAQFLSGDRNPPEKQALLAMIGGLAHLKD